jgi:hypothetical protein
MCMPVGSVNCWNLSMTSFSFLFQLSSKCDNRLFRIRFHMLKSGSYPFFEAFSPPIRCISRGRNTRVSSVMWKRSTSTIHPHNLSQSSGVDEGSLELQHNSVNEARPYSSSKRVRSGHDRLSTTFKTDPNVERPDEECNSHPQTANKVLLRFPFLSFFYVLLFYFLNIS